VSNVRSRFLALLGVVAVAGALLAAPSVSSAATPKAAPAAAGPVTSTSHPYSDPLYLPLHSKFYMDCAQSNPGCPVGHAVWQMDLIPYGQYRTDGNTPSRARVLAMGAGVLHVGDAKGDACPAKATSFGTWVWIDHGGGYVSLYGHLSNILVKNGALVTAGEAIGTVGTTGKGGSCSVNYTDIKVEHNGQNNANTVPIKTLRACVGKSTKAAVWPSAAHAKYPVWNDVPQHTVFPASTAACLPAGAPTSATAPKSTALSPSGAGNLTARWAKPAAASKVGQVLVEFAAYHSSTKKWDSSTQETYVLLPVRSTMRQFTKLIRNHEYRTRVSFHNAAGWSRASAWSVRKAT
jgi:hypothetical protein